MTTTAADDTTHPDARHHGPRVLAGLVLGLTVAVCLMLLAFAAPAIHSGPHDLPLAVAGPEPAVTEVTSALQERSPGAFEVITYASADEVTAAIEQREAIGGIVLGADGVTIEVASAAGAPYAPLLRNLGAGLAASGQQVTYEDVVPLTQDDPTGAGLSALALPLVFGGLASAGALVTLFKRSRTLRVAGSVAFSVLAGIAATVVLQYWFGTVDGPFWATAAAVSLGIAAISLTILGLESLLGYPGLALGALLMVFIANPLSGMATGPLWLPTPWGTIGQLLPVGAAGTSIRSVAFFDGNGSGAALLVLAIWAVLGLALVGLSSLRRSSVATTS